MLVFGLMLEDLVLGADGTSIREEMTACLLRRGGEKEFPLRLGSGRATLSLLHDTPSADVSATHPVLLPAPLVSPIPAFHQVYVLLLQADEIEPAMVFGQVSKGKANARLVPGHYHLALLRLLAPQSMESFPHPWVMP